MVRTHEGCINNTKTLGRWWCARTGCTHDPGEEDCGLWMTAADLWAELRDRASTEPMAWRFGVPPQEVGKYLATVQWRDGTLEVLVLWHELEDWCKPPDSRVVAWMPYPRPFEEVRDGR